MKRKVGIPSKAPTLRSRIKAYREMAAEMKAYLAKHPKDWGKYQSDFNQEINGIFRDLMIFEKENLANGREDQVYKLKRLFTRHFRSDFVKGKYLSWSLSKPQGYAGDYKIIDDIYLNAPDTDGFDRLFDNYYQMSSICIAVRNRKEDFKRIALDVIEKNKGNKVKIMDLASGPCRDVFEVLSSPSAEKKKDLEVHCYDNDQMAIEYAKKLMNFDPRVKFFKENAVKIALRKNISETIDGGYDLIFSTGLFDYLDKRVSTRLIANLKKLLNKGGIIAISDVRDKFSNPSLYFMEWVADWNLVYRADDEFRTIFLEAGFSDKDLVSIAYEQQGVLQYITARN